MRKLPKNFVVIDLETTGLDPKACGILEIGAVDASGRRFYRRVSLGRGRRVEWQALDCNGIDALDLGIGERLEDAVDELAGWLRDPGDGRWILGGKNPQFDYGFLESVWPKRVDSIRIGELISRRCVDLHTLAYGMAIRSGWDMTADDFSTDDIYRALGMEPEPKPHNALRGAIHEMEGFRRVLLGQAADTPPGEFDALMAQLERENFTVLLDENFKEEVK